MPSCFVPGCKSGYTSTQRRNKILGVKNPSLFSVPSDELERWQAAIPFPREYKLLKASDKVCELHFTEECIERDFLTNLPDGDVVVIRRARVKLKTGAIPTLFPNQTEYFSRETSKINSPNFHVLQVKNKQKRKVSVVQEDSIPTLFPDQSEYLSTETAKINSPNFHVLRVKNKQKRKVSVVQEDSIPILFPDQSEYLSTETSKTYSPIVHVLQVKKKVSISEEGIPSFNNEEQVGNFDYSHLIQHLESVEKPNLWWTVSFCQDYVICTKLNRFFNADKKVAVCQDLTTKVFLRNIEVPSLSVTITDIDSLTALLSKVDGLTICEGAGSSNNSCSIYNEVKTPIQRKTRKWCEDCRRYRDAEMKRIKRMNQKKIRLANTFRMLIKEMNF